VKPGESGPHKDKGGERSKKELIVGLVGSELTSSRGEGQGVLLETLRAPQEDPTLCIAARRVGGNSFFRGELLMDCDEVFSLPRRRESEDLRT